MPRDTRRPIVVTEESDHTELLEKREQKRINHYATPVMTAPNRAQRRSLRKLTHIWTTGDTLMKLAEKHYGDPSLWYVLAWYNTGPTDAHYKLGSKIYIPQPISQVLSILRSY